MMLQPWQDHLQYQNPCSLIPNPIFKIPHQATVYYQMLIRHTTHQHLDIKATAPVGVMATRNFTVL